MLLEHTHTHRFAMTGSVQKASQITPTKAAKEAMENVADRIAQSVQGHGIVVFITTVTNDEPEVFLDFARVVNFKVDQCKELNQKFHAENEEIQKEFFSAKVMVLPCIESNFEMMMQSIAAAHHGYEEMDVMEWPVDFQKLMSNHHLRYEFDKPRFFLETCK